MLNGARMKYPAEGRSKRSFILNVSQKDEL